MPRMICAPVSLICAGVRALTVPWVPTGMKMGVSMVPCSVDNRPRRAAVAVSVLISWKVSLIHRSHPALKLDPLSIAG